MTPTIFMGLVLILAIALGVGAISILYQILTNFQPSDSKINADIRTMRAEIDKMNLNLVSWDKEELELFSLNQINQLVKKNITTTAKGVFTSIYQEPMLAYSFKKYVSPSLNAVLYARTAEHEYVYRIRKDSIKIMIDGQAIGVLDKEGALYSPQKKQLLAQLPKGSEDLMLPIIVNNKEVGHITNPKKTNAPNPRAFDLVATDMTKAEEEVFLALGVLEVIQRSI